MVFVNLFVMNYRAASCGVFIIPRKRDKRDGENGLIIRELNAGC
jgi:hypothetical protein